MFFKRFQKEGIVNLVHDSDLQKILINLNKLGDVEDGKVKCKFTKEIISIDNLHAVFYENNDIKFVSGSIDAVKMFSEYLNERTYDV